MRLYLVEDYSPAIKYSDGDLIVPLTPHACYQLDLKKIPYSIPEDYYNQEEIFAKSKYNEDQCQWIFQLDKFLQDSIQEVDQLNLRLGNLYHYFIKTHVLDPLYVRCYVLNHILDSTEPSEVVFISRPPRNMLLTEQLEDSSESYYSRIIPICCRERNIPLIRDFVKTSRKCGGNSGIVTDGAPKKIARALLKYKSMAKIYNRAIFMWRYLTNKQLSQHSDRRKLKILALNGNSRIWPNVVTDALRRGHIICQLSTDSIIRYSPMRFRTQRYPVENSKLGTSLWEQVADDLANTNLIEKINEICGLDVSETVVPRLRYFVSVICPIILNHFKFFEQYFERERFDLVLAPYAMSPVELAALAAANSKGLSTVSLCHGDEVTENKFWRTFELSNFGVHIFSNTETQGAYEALSRNMDINVQTFVSKHRLSNIIQIRQSREKDTNTIIPNRVFYLPIPFTWDARRLDDRYQETWYFRFQQTILEYFAKRTEYSFIWKGLPQSESIDNPVPDFISGKGFKNIEVATVLFVNCLSSADRVICDYPSTGFYEAVAAGIPTMSLYHEAFTLNKSSVEYYGNLLKPFEDTSTAINHIEEFLDGDPEFYQKKIDIGDKSIIDVLEEIVETGNCMR